MITIPEIHYRKLVSTVQLLHSNIGILFPNMGQVQEVYQQWQIINQEMVDLSKKIINDLQEIKGKTMSVQGQNRQLKEKIDVLTGKNEQLLKTNTIQRAELAKNSSEYLKLKEIAKAMKTALKQKQEEVKGKKLMLQELSEKGKKYKRLYQDQVKKVEKLDQMVAFLQVTQRSSAKEKELDQEMQDLQAELLQMEQGDKE